MFLQTQLEMLCWLWFTMRSLKLTWFIMILFTLIMLSVRNNTGAFIKLSLTLALEHHKDDFKVNIAPFSFLSKIQNYSITKCT